MKQFSSIFYDKIITEEEAPTGQRVTVTMNNIDLVKDVGKLKSLAKSVNDNKEQSKEEAPETQMEAVLANIKMI